MGDAQYDLSKLFSYNQVLSRKKYMRSALLFKNHVFDFFEKYLIRKYDYFSRKHNQT